MVTAGPCNRCGQVHPFTLCADRTGCLSADGPWPGTERCWQRWPELPEPPYLSGALEALRA